MFKMPQIDKFSSVPLYYQLYLILKKLIEKDRFQQGDIFYSENELERIFGVSRITIRRALDMLEDEGYIQRSQGSNSIVLSGVRDKLWWNLFDITNDLKKEGQKVTSKIIRIEKVVPTKKISSALKLDNKDTFVYCIERVRKVDTNKITRSISYLVPCLPVDLTTIHFSSKTSIQNVLECMGQIYSYCDETIEAIIGDKITCQYLDLEDNSPIFYRERITYNQSHIPIEFVISYYNAKFCKYYVKDKVL